MKRSEIAVGMRVVVAFSSRIHAACREGVVRDLRARNHFMEPGEPDRIRVTMDTGTEMYVPARQIVRLVVAK